MKGAWRSAAAALLLTGCGGASATPSASGSPSAGGAGDSPGPVRTIVRSARTLPAGGTITLRAQAGVALRLTASAPAVSRTRLSGTHGYAPAHGYYLSIRVTVVNAGRRTVQIGPGDFFVRRNTGPRVTSYDGNSPYSGASSQLDTTELQAGERVKAPLTFDTAWQHGRFVYAPDGSPAVVWRF